MGNLTIPSVQNSELPGLLGKQALCRNRAVWDFVSDTLYFLGPGDFDLEKALPPGTDKFQLYTAPSGHSVLPCCEYDGSDEQSGESSLTLITKRHDPSGSQLTDARGMLSIPPPPSQPPVLPVLPKRSEWPKPPPQDASSTNN